VSQLRTDGFGHTERLGPVRVGDPADGGIAVDVDVFDDAGALADPIRGRMFPNSHFPGGVVTLDRVLPDGWTARVHDPVPREMDLYWP
jgi:hypothetical protein